MTERPPKAPLPHVRTARPEDASSTLWTKPPPGNPPLPPAPSDPFRLLDEEEPPAAYGRDTVGLLVREPRTLFSYWEVTPLTLDLACRSLGIPPSSAHRVLRMVWTPPFEPEDSRDFVVHTDVGRAFLPAPQQEGAWVRILLGVLTPHGAFTRLAESARVRVPYASPGPEGPLEWLYVEPLRGRLVERAPLVAQPRQLGHPGGPPLGDGLPLPGASEQLGRRHAVPSSSGMPPSPRKSS